MSDVVVRLPIGGAVEGEHLSCALDSFAKLFSEAEPNSDAFMMMKTEVLDGAVIKCLVFEARSHAAAFLSFWRQERRRLHS